MIDYEFPRGVDPYEDHGPGVLQGLMSLFQLYKQNQQQATLKQAGGQAAKTLGGNSNPMIAALAPLLGTGDQNVIDSGLRGMTSLFDTDATTKARQQDMAQSAAEDMFNRDATSSNIATTQQGDDARAKMERDMQLQIASQAQAGETQRQQQHDLSEYGLPPGSQMQEPTKPGMLPPINVGNGAGTNGGIAGGLINNGILGLLAGEGNPVTPPTQATSPEGKPGADLSYPQTSTYGAAVNSLLAPLVGSQGVAKNTGAMSDQSNFDNLMRAHQAGLIKYLPIGPNDLQNPSMSPQAKLYFSQQLQKQQQQRQQVQQPAGMAGLLASPFGQ